MSCVAKETGEMYEYKFHTSKHFVDTPFPLANV